MKLPHEQKMPLFIREGDICLQSLLNQPKCVEFA